MNLPHRLQYLWCGLVQSLWPNNQQTGRSSRDIFSLLLDDPRHRVRTRQFGRRGLYRVGPHCAITICEVLVRFTGLSFTRNMLKMNLYCTCTCTTLPGLLFGLHVVVTFRLLLSKP